MRDKYTINLSFHITTIDTVGFIENKTQGFRIILEFPELQQPE